ncbi:ATP-grasp domain-containing protein [Rathayibacter toxicus]|uniref:ATP-grasp domain-containing protein n=1 Tax=Rathayibacter toxicus TaxID=145458 RepID=UPI001C04F9B0|nr:ATP-grasp domain-containing protein [Rathayibacter toxicus]QWL32249.1 ATP-grasp domain-containing protein [Rathayibacter toxicus]QWL34342.1 ATP-grasp domain-containing protein [Rathayibacter toxicus]QWL36475.1 ATP-grasp domain-containing protein [Rathayibacter toxicus]QWL38565.1 ATP-grasp domain-containing protein [Rathayibacter toxicus]QWL40653.1 ATP-grasp domain-containing protein [Rathayibacter toxicus]
MTTASVLVVGRGFSAYRGYVLEELHEAGVETWVADDEPLNALQDFDRYFEVDFDCGAAAEAQRLRQHRADWSDLVGVCYIESLLCWAAEFFEALQVPFLSPTEARLLRSKSRQRKAFAEAGIRSPWNRVGTPDQIQQQVLEFPLVIKPENGYSSIGVELVRSPRDLSVYFSRDNNVHSDEFVVEGVIQGREYSIEGYARADKVVAFAKTVKFKTPLPFFEEIGQFCARDVTPNESERDLFSRVVDALGVSDSVFHLEYFESPGQLVPVEVGGRLGGDKIPYLHRRVTGRSLLLEHLDVVHEFDRSAKTGMGIVFFVPSVAGRVSSAFPSKELLESLGEHCLETEADKQVLIAPDDFFVRLGFAILEAESVEEFVLLGNEKIALFEQETGVTLHRL